MSSYLGLLGVEQSVQEGVDVPAAVFHQRLLIKAGATTEHSNHGLSKKKSGMKTGKNIIANHLFKDSRC